MGLLSHYVCEKPLCQQADCQHPGTLRPEPLSGGGEWRHFALSVLAIIVGASSAPDARAIERSTLIFGGDRANPPYEWLEDGTARGFGVELAQALADIGGVEAEHRLSDRSEALKALGTGKIDVVTMFQSEEREEQFLFTPPFHFIHHAVYGHPDSPSIIAIADLGGKRVAVEQGSYVQERLRNESYGIELIETSSAVTALEAIRDSRADYAILSIEIAASLLDRNDPQIRRVGQPLWSVGFAFAVPRDNRELADWLTERYYEVVREGIYQDLYARWEDRLDPNIRPDADRLLRIAIVALAALSLFGAAAAVRFRRQAAAQSLDLAEEAKRRQVAESKVRWLSEHDFETELPRLPRFAAMVEELLASSAPSDAPKQIVALKVADADKVIQARGHKAATELIQDFANWLRSMNFEICGQDGKDVFLVFDDKRKVVTELASTVSPDDTAIFQVSRSRPQFFAGAATWQNRSQKISDLIQQAETALAKAVEDREPWLEYRPSMDPDKFGLELIELFRTSAGEGIYPLFQPQIDIASRRIVSAEILVRWDAPGLGPIPPAQFIPLIEDAGLIRHVTRRMLRESIRVAARLRNTGIGCPISVNMAPSDLLNPKLLEKIRETVAAHGGRTADLKLELTETSFAKHSNALLWSMMRLQAEGIRLSIDDFGTGYSSLAYLSELPVAELKIDRSFVRGMSTNAKSKSIVRSTIEMGHELELIVVAEGVENEAQLEMLGALGCDRVQGYLVAKPLTERAFMELVVTNSVRWRPT